MKHVSLVKRSLILATSVIILAACNAFAGQGLQPTVDTQATMVAVRTEAAGVVQTELASQPTATSLPAATETPVATAPQTLPTETPTSLPTATLPPPPPQPATRTPAPVVAAATWTASPSPFGCTITAASPASDTAFAPNADFDGRWTLKNTGTQAWLSYEIDYRWAETGTELQTGSKIYDLPKDVKSSESIEIVVDMKAPATVGKYTTTWVLTKGGQTLCTMVVKIEVK